MSIAKSYQFESEVKARKAMRDILGVPRLTREQGETVKIAVNKHARRQELKRELAAIEKKNQSSAKLRVENRRQRLCVLVGQSYHDRFTPLYASERGEVLYGESSPGIDWNAYARSYGHPARWTNAGARIETIDGERFIVLQNYRGNDVAQIPYQPLKDEWHNKKRPAIFDSAALLQGDLYGIVKRRDKDGNVLVADRYGWSSKKGFYKTGVAARYSTEGTGKTGKTGTTYWEHGKKLRDCQRENRHKREVFAINQAVKQADKKALRAARLIARLCPELPVKYDHARAVGYCEAGIKSFMDRHGLTGNCIAAKDVRHLESGVYSVQRVIERAALELAATKFKAKGAV